MIDLALRWMPLATVMTAVFAFCCLLFLATAVRKLDTIYEELKKANGTDA